MTEITYSLQDDSFFISSQGHAGYAPKGSDIVCAGVSTLMQTLLYRVSDITLNYNYSMSDGILEVSSTDKEVKEVFCTIICGLNLLASEYPDYVSVKSVPY